MKIQLNATREALKEGVRQCWYLPILLGGITYLASALLIAAQNWPSFSSAFVEESTQEVAIAASQTPVAALFFAGAASIIVVFVLSYLLVSLTAIERTTFIGIPGCLAYVYAVNGFTVQGMLPAFWGTPLMMAVVASVVVSVMLALGWLARTRKIAISS